MLWVLVFLLLLDLISTFVVVKDVLAHDTEGFRSVLGLSSLQFSLSNSLNVVVLLLPHHIELDFELNLFPFF